MIDTATAQVANGQVKKASMIIREALPLMVKHKIPPTPNYYALWYSYIARQVPALNASIDKIIADSNTITAAQCDGLYQQYLATENEEELKALRKAMATMLEQVGSALDDSVSGTSEFEAVLDSSFSSLSRLDPMQLSGDTEAQSALSDLLAGSEAIKMVTGRFKEQMKEQQREIADLKNALEVSQKNALFDALTGIYNRRSFDADITELQEGANPYCLVMMDIDHFKAFNDTYGHAMGDQVLKLVAQKINQKCHRGSRFYRYGGEEFALLITDMRLRNSFNFANRLRGDLEKLSIIDNSSGDRINNITASFGVVEYKQGETIEAMIHRADKQLYEAKTNGRNQVKPFVT